VIYENSKLYLVMELCPMNLGMLFEEKRAKKEHFSEKDIKKYIKDIIKGTECLHKHGYMHRDLKPENILVSEDDKLKLTDFGTIKSTKDKLSMTHYVSTRWYRAPEWILEVEKYDEKSDVFAVGCILAEFFTLKPIFCGSSSRDQLLRYLKAMGIKQIDEWKEGSDQFKKLWIDTSSYNAPELSKMIPNTSESALDLITKMLSLDPTKRPSLKEVLNHQFFKNETIVSNSTSASNLRKLPKLTKITISRIEDSEGSPCSKDSTADTYDQYDNSARVLIKNQLNSKINQLHQLDLSRVAETDGESSFDCTQIKHEIEKPDVQKSRFNQTNNNTR